jgi:hypothetical protein
MRCSSREKLSAVWLTCTGLEQQQQQHVLMQQDSSGQRRGFELVQQAVVGVTQLPSLSQANVQQPRTHKWLAFGSCWMKLCIVRLSG